MFTFNEIITFIDKYLGGTNIGQEIIKLILVLFGLAFIALIINVCKVIREKQALKKAKSKFKESVNTQQLIGAVVETMMEALPQSIVKRRINTLYCVRQIHSISTDLLERMDILEEDKRYSLIRFVTNILLILGLLGTVVGLSISVENIVPAIKEAQNLADVTTLANALSQTMGGLHTAFYTTLAGLACTFILLMFVYLAQRYENYFLSDLEHFTVYDLMPRILISSETEANTLYLEAIEKSANDIASASEVLDKSREGIESIVSGLVRATNTTADRMVDFFNFAQSFQESVANLMSYKDDIHMTYQKIENVLREIKDNQLTDKMIGEIVDKSVARSLAATQEAAETVREAFKSDIAKIEEGQAKYIGETQNLVNAIKSISTKSAEQLGTKVDESFQKALSTFRKELETVSKREDISRMIASDATESFRQFVDESIDANKKTDIFLQKLISTLEANKKTDAILEKLNQTLEKITTIGPKGPRQSAQSELKKTGIV